MEFGKHQPVAVSTNRYLVKLYDFRTEIPEYFVIERINFVLFTS